MITKEKSFYSDGYRLAATLYLPNDYREGEKRPCIIPNSGYIGLNSIYPAMFARALTARGFVCLGFDYRGFLRSEGPAGVCKLDEQVEDIRSAITFAQTLAEADPMFVGHGVNNHLHPISEAKEFYKKLRAPKRYYVINGKHNDFMFDDHPEFVKLIDQLDDFFQVL